MFACSGEVADKISANIAADGWTYKGGYGRYISNGKEHYGDSFMDGARLVAFDYHQDQKTGDVRATVHHLPYQYLPEHMKAENAAA
jgi:hypothetical protein